MTTSINDTTEEEVATAKEEEVLLLKRASHNNNRSGAVMGWRGGKITFLCLLSLFAVHQAAYTISTNYYTASPKNHVPLVTNYSSLIALATPPKATSAEDDQKLTFSSETLPIYLIDTTASSSPQTSNNITSTTSTTVTIAISTWGKIAAAWNHTTEYSQLFSFASTVASLPNRHNKNSNTKGAQSTHQRQIILMHTGPKVGSTTLRHACNRNFFDTCASYFPPTAAVNDSSKVYDNTIAAFRNSREARSRSPPGYFGGNDNRLVSLMERCVDTYWFCVNQITPMVIDDDGNNDNSSNNDNSGDDDDDGDDEISTTTVVAAAGSRPMSRATKLLPNAHYIHLFPFRNYNDWVKSAIKQTYDRSKDSGCNSLMKHWLRPRRGRKNTGCIHSQMEIDIRKYGRVDLDRFQDGIVRRMNYINSHNNGDGEEDHTLILYLHRDMEKVVELISSVYNIPMLRGTDSTMKGRRPKGTCNATVEDQYHGCFSDMLMNFRWDLPENQV